VSRFSRIELAAITTPRVIARSAMPFLPACPPSARICALALVVLPACWSPESSPVLDSGVSSSSTDPIPTDSSSSDHADDDGSSSTTPVDPDTSTSSSDDAPATTESSSDDSTTASPPSCNLGPTPADEIAFAPPVPLPGVNSAYSEEHGWLSSDELTLWLTTIRDEGTGGYDVFLATRGDVADPFGPLTPLATLNTTSNEERPVVTADGLTLYCASNNAATTGSFDVMVATRPSTLVDFGPLVSVANGNSPDSDSAPHISADGSELYFGSNRSGNAEIYRAELGVGGAFEPATVVGELGGPESADGDPTPSADGLTIYFSSDRDDVSNIYVATRSTRDDGFGEPVAVDDLNTDVLDWPVWLSDDGCRLLLASSREGEGGYDLWIAERAL
jgi:hypothetical protein